MSELALIYAILTTLFFVQAAVWTVVARDRKERRHMALLAVVAPLWPLLLMAGLSALVVGAYRGRVAS